MAIERIKVLKFKELGQLFIDWATGMGAPRPKTLADFVDQTVTPGILDHFRVT